MQRLEVSGAVGSLLGSLGLKGLREDEKRGVLEKILGPKEGNYQ